MPRKAIDYSNTIIYKLCCKDPIITDVYVGHTTDFVSRKKTHKSRCIASTTKYHYLYVYQFIRDNGGWTNWDMVEIARISCIDSRDASRHERIYIEQLNATLNTQIPSMTCINGNYVDRYTYKHQYANEHSEHISEYKKTWYDTNKTNILEKLKNMYTQNKEAILERSRLARQAKKELQIGK